MAAHEEILEAARRISGRRPDHSFTPDEIVRALPHLNPSTVRTHIVSRCCTNAPKNHPHKWDYFERIDRGHYVVAPRYRTPERGAATLREQQPGYGAPLTIPRRGTIHAAVSNADGWFTAACLEIAVVTQGRTFDETLENLRDAIALHLEEETPEQLGLSRPISLSITFEQDLG